MSSVNVNAQERSVQSLEKEIMRLQEVLKERETEITALEETVKEQQARGRSGTRTPSSVPSEAPLNGDPALHLSPKTMSQFQALRRSLDLSLYQSGNDSVPENDESLDRLNELMRCVGIHNRSTLSRECLTVLIPIGQWPRRKSLTARR